MTEETLDYQIQATKDDHTIDFSINLLKSDTTNYQLMYASQLYGTFFCVFGKLIINGNKLDSIELKLINYKGIINLGLLQPTEDSWEALTMEMGHQFKLYLRAADGTHGLDPAKTVTVTCDTLLSDLSTILVGRDLREMHSNLTLEQQLKQGMFDSEFYERDGAFIFKKPHTDEIHNDYMNTQNPPLAAGSVCETSKLTVV